jgi:hypothetical protein
VTAGCGGSDGAAPTPQAAAPTSTSYSAGPIEGFGSIIVGGVRWDESAATITDDRGNRAAAGALRLGMMVEIDGAALDRGLGQGRALAVRFGAEAVGPIASIDAAAGTFVVLGRTVAVNDRTVFDASLAGGLAALAVGQVVEVHGIIDAASGQVVATRIEDKAGATEYRLRGAVSNLNTTAKTFTIGSTLVSYAGVAAAALPPQLTDGLTVLAILATAPVDGAWVATDVNGGFRRPDNRSDAHVEGMVTAWTSATSFDIRGLHVDASRASFPDGTAGVVLGARVRVDGALVGGTLVATRVEVETRRMAGARPFALHGAITSVDRTAMTFALRGVTVSYAGNVAWKGGDAESLAAGRMVHVAGVPSRDRTRLDAMVIDFN